LFLCIPGLDEGILGLCEGAKANLVIPPDFGYGPKGVKNMVPGGATVHYDVEVVTIRRNFFKTLDTDRDGKLTKSEVEAFFETIDQVMPDEMWEQEDKNGDGVISWQEFSGAKGNVMVGVYSGPTDCPDESRVQKGNHISLHYTGSIDEFSATGTPGYQFDSSRARSKPVDITIGVGKVIKGELF
jgi:FKBP-type peptidyl-prolyl cis-trans isomerase 2